MNKESISLFFMNPISFGGHVTYTVHLMIALKLCGSEVKLYKVRNRDEQFERDFGYGESYRNVSIETAKKICRKSATLITAPSKPERSHIDELLKAGARIVIHDPAEFKHGWDVKWACRRRPIVIRKSMIRQVDGSVFIPHPYDPFGEDKDQDKRKFGISVSRIDFDKNTHILLDANRELPKTKRIEIRGFENRIYTRFNIMPVYPEWVQSKAAYPKELRYAYKLCAPYQFMFDMSTIKNDGGGTQYTFLEAIDAGCVCVLNKDWILKKGVMQPGKNCLAVEDHNGILSVYKKYHRRFGELKEINNAARKMLRKHSPHKIGRAYVEELLT